ncbi:DUF2809 domain-containing protein [Roseateles sp.]|uniref:ribosomal maturation YjgA family protein n=1 Tax=Roseateles sp. TaxID=1971397 RepID=UPI003264D39F
MPLPDSPRPVRTRSRYALATLGVIAMGLASRHWHGLFPSGLGKYPGDALWCAMVFFALGALRPAASTAGNAALALGISFCIEFLKLWQAPWLVEVRHTTLGHLVFGHVFSWQNLVAYAVGAALAAAVELAVFAGMSRLAARRGV